MTLSSLGERGEACPPSAHPSETAQRAVVVGGGWGGSQVKPSEA